MDQSRPLVVLFGLKLIKKRRLSIALLGTLLFISLILYLQAYYSMKKQGVLLLPEVAVSDQPFYQDMMKEMNDARVDQEDPRLVQLIRDYFIDAPSDKEYNLKNSSVMDTPMGQSEYVDKYLNSKNGGFFVECGAFDGDFLSNSMFFERARNWTGVLIEADPVTYQMLKKKNRKAYTLNACLSTKPYPSVVTFSIADVRGRIEEDEDQKQWIEKEQWHTIEKIKVQCFPLTSILLALGKNTVDYLSLDIEGDELKVLKTIPMKKIDIRIMSVEVTDQTPEERSLTSYLTLVGFKRLIHMRAKYVRDAIYGKE